MMANCRAEAGLHPLLVCDLAVTLQNIPNRMSQHDGSLRKELAKIFEEAVRNVEPLIITQQFLHDYSLLVGTGHHETPKQTNG